MTKRLPIVVALAALCSTAAEDRLWEYRNLGKAFYENPTTHREAAVQFRKALDLAPNSARERINYGLALLRSGDTANGIAELVRAQKQDPAIPHTWFNLGIAYKRNAEFDRALEQLQHMVKLVPDEPIAHYNLGAVLKALGRADAAIAEFAIAEKLNPDLAGPHFQLFNLYRQAGKADMSAREQKAFQDAKTRSQGAVIPEDMEWCYYAEVYDRPEPRSAAASAPTKYDDRSLGSGWDAATSGMEVLDAEGNGHADLLVWSRDRVALYKRGAELVKNSGLEALRGIESISAGDFDNDGLPDICVITAAGATLYHNAHGTFVKGAVLPGTAGVHKALWLDYDHDYDLDLLLFGPHPMLIRNNGGGNFSDHTAAFPFVKGDALDAVEFAVRDDTAARDVVVSYKDRAGTLYRDKLNGVFEAMDLPAVSAGVSALAVQDFNHDGLLDLVSYLPETRAWRNDAGKLVRADKAQPAASQAHADFNGDTREDYARILADGSLHVYFNASPAERWAAVRIEGVKNIKLANGATVEVKSGAVYAKAVYRGAPLALALNGHATVDTVRITWPNGLIQNETQQKAGQLLTFKEAQRLSGSCPMIFTWNGRAFEFITDVLGVAPLGASSGDGNYFPVDHDEYIQIPGDALKPRAGQYEIRVTEELREVSYLDQIRLIAVDHPADVEIYTNDKFKSPPYPEFRLFGTGNKIHAVRALDGRGADVTDRLLHRDQTYPDGFARDFAGVAETHTLDLDFGNAAKDNRAALVLNGWVDWADGSTFLGASQSGNGGLVFPYMQVKDSAGNWQTVVPDMGIPSGKPKTITVDLTGKFLSASREVRIVTNLCVYWDEVFLLEDARAPQTKLTPLDVSAADLHFRGFSTPVIHPARRQPEQFHYDQLMALSMWNPTPGKYTRYGDVRELMTAIDDRMVIMGSGDELTLHFPAGKLPRLAPGWSRDFLLLVDGWAKDADANTAFGDQVDPLPFHGMSAYPYRGDEHFPSDEVHRRYVEDYLTRPALKLIRPLAPMTP